MESLFWKYRMRFSAFEPEPEAKMAMFFFIILEFNAQNSEKCAKDCIYLVKYLRKTINIHSFAPQI